MVCKKTSPSRNILLCSSGRWVTAAINVAGSANLVAGNIKKGINIFNVVGTYIEYVTVGNEHPGEVYTVEWGQGNWHYITEPPTDSNNPLSLDSHFYTWNYGGTDGVRVTSASGWTNNNNDWVIVCKLPSTVSIPDNPYFTIWTGLFGGSGDVLYNQNDIFMSHYGTTNVQRYQFQGEIRLTKGVSWTDNPYIFNFWCYRQYRPWCYDWLGRRRQIGIFEQSTNRVTMPSGQYYFHLLIWFGSCFGSTDYYGINVHI